MSNQRRNKRKVWTKLFSWMRDRNNGVLDLRFAALFGAELQGADLQDVDLRESNLQYANLNKANLHHANLCKANLWNANLKNANLCNANLKNGDLQHADLRHADLRHADLRHADLQYTNIQNENLRYSVLTHPINMTSTNVDVHYIVATNTYGVDCYSGNVEAFIAKTIEVRPPKQAKQIFYRCLSFGVEEHEQRFLDAIDSISKHI